LEGVSRATTAVGFDRADDYSLRAAGARITHGIDRTMCMEALKQSLATTGWHSIEFGY
jgi:hypothetical protein